MAVTTAPLAIERTLPEAWTRHLPDVDAALRRVPFPRSSRVGAMLTYHLGWTDAQGRPHQGSAGKMLRALLCVWACEACGGRAADALDAALAIELIHNFTLVHDDIQDGDLERRHRPTVWALWGSAQAINAGDGLHALAHRTLARPGRHPARRLAVARDVGDAVLEVIEGQCLDLDLEGRLNTAPSTYLRLAGAKTGALFGAALEAGATMAGRPAAVSGSLRGAGRLLGGAFQIRDDWLGIWGDPARTGKSTGGDLARRKTTFPVVTAYAEAPPEVRRTMRRLFACDRPGAEDELAAILEDLGMRDRTATVALDLAADATRMVARSSLPADRVAEFADLAEFAAERDR